MVFVVNVLWAVLGAMFVGLACYLFVRSRRGGQSPWLRWALVAGVVTYAVAGEVWNWLDDDVRQIHAELISVVGAIVGLSAFILMLALPCGQKCPDVADGEERH